MNTGFVKISPLVAAIAACWLSLALAGAALGQASDSQPEPKLDPEPSSEPNMPFRFAGAPLEAKFGNGFELVTKEKDFSIQLHGLTHVDGRFFEQGDQRPLTDSFVIPRSRFILNGAVGERCEYSVVINHGFSSLNLLDAFLDVRLDDRARLRVGRFKTPYTYEFYIQSTVGFITPERSLLFNNFGLNRDVGAMLWGSIWDKKLDYAAGIFNGSRNGFIDTNDEKDLAAFVNWKPFADQKETLFEHLQIGGSVNYGNQFNDPNPPILRLFSPAPVRVGNATGPAFLTFHPDAVEQGERLLWSAHAIWCVGPLSLQAEYEGGFRSMAPRSDAPRTKVALNSFYVMAGWLLTGESVAERGTIKPNRDFDLRKGKEGTGAVELFARYNLLDIDRDVFDAGLADPDKWARRVQTTDVGVHWYWNAYVRWTLAWQHGTFDRPVEYAAGRSQTDSDLFLVRCQVAF